MTKFQKVLKYVSIIIFIAGAISILSGIVSIIGGEKVSGFDATATIKILNFLSGGFFFIIGGILNLACARYGILSSQSYKSLTLTITLGIFSLVWQAVGFMVFLLNGYVSIRTIPFLILTIIFIFLLFVIKIKSSKSVSKAKKSVNLSSVVDTSKIKQKHVHIPAFSKKRKAVPSGAKLPRFMSNIHVKRRSVGKMRKFRRR